MELIIGGSFQGKLNYVKQKFKQRGVILQEDNIADGADVTCDELTAGISGSGTGLLVLDHLHLLVRKGVQDGTAEEIYSVLKMLLRNNPDCIMICDEVGYGVVPTDRMEREYRETVGRVLCFLAQRADSVERITGGLPLKIK